MLSPLYFCPTEFIMMGGDLELFRDRYAIKLLLVGLHHSVVDFIHFISTA